MGSTHRDEITTPLLPTAPARSSDKHEREQANRWRAQQTKRQKDVFDCVRARFPYHPSAAIKQMEATLQKELTNQEVGNGLETLTSWPWSARHETQRWGSMSGLDQ